MSTSSKMNRSKCIFFCLIFKHFNNFFKSSFSELYSYEFVSYVVTRVVMHFSNTTKKDNEYHYNLTSRTFFKYVLLNFSMFKLIY